MGGAVIKYIGVLLNSETSSILFLTQFITTCELLVSTTRLPSCHLVVDGPRLDQMLVDKRVQHVVIFLRNEGMQQIPPQAFPSVFHHCQQNLHSLWISVCECRCELGFPYIVGGAMEKLRLALIVKCL